MAISVDTIYQRVLTLANKEQRGYITPQEFNLIANQAQMAIFESYFYTKNQRDRAEPDRTGEVDETDIDELLGAKLSPFRKVQAVTGGHTFLGKGTILSVERDVFQTGRVFLGNDVCHKLSLNGASRILRSKRHIAATADQFPIYADNPADGKDILVYAGSATAETTITAEYFLVPRPVEWTYVVVKGRALFNNAVAVDFELHRSEEDTLVYNILGLAGIVMNKVGLAQTAAQMGGAEQQVQNT